jgi:hypothetical protein
VLVECRVPASPQGDTIELVPADQIVTSDERGQAQRGPGFALCSILGARE